MIRNRRLLLHVMPPNYGIGAVLAHRYNDWFGKTYRVCITDTRGCREKVLTNRERRFGLRFLPFRDFMPIFMGEDLR